jgi:hypothetical protein
LAVPIGQCSTESLKVSPIFCSPDPIVIDIESGWKDEAEGPKSDLCRQGRDAIYERLVVG